MSSSSISDFAQRVKKFYHRRAFLCEQLYTEGAINFVEDSPEMPPEGYEPLRNLYRDAFVLACAVIDGLSSIWEAVQPPPAPLGNQGRFTTFLSTLNVDSTLDLVCTPFLYHILTKQAIEQPFRDEVFNRWVRRENEYTGHEVYNDPTESVLRNLYASLSQGEIKAMDETLAKFKYSSLVYKYYRCSFIHEFRPSRYVETFSREEEISVRHWTGTNYPKIDIGLGVFTKAIRLGADEVERLILANGLTNIPYGRDDIIRIQTN